MTGWVSLEAELDRWGTEGRRATFWWRDDDAADTGDAFDRLLDVTDTLGTALALAVIPGRATERLAARVDGTRDISVLQHGCDHQNRQPGGRKAELGDARPATEVMEQVATARQRMVRLFPDALSVLVPPWNRIAPALIPHLTAIGIDGLSRFGPRRSRLAADGLTETNTHIDIIDWHGGRGFRGDEAVLDAAVTHLSARRGGACDPDEPTGLLSHHLVHDAECWRFIERFIRQTASHGAACWLPARAAFGAP